MSIQVNIFNSGSVPTATELANFISELNTDLDSIVTLNTEQIIEGAKTFCGSKMLKFKQKVSADKLGFTFYDYQGKEVGNFEYDNKNNFRLLALGNYFSAANQEIEGHVGFKVYNKSALSAYRLLCPLAGNAKNSISSLTDTYTNFYMPLVFTNGAASVMADSTGKVDLSTLIGSGGDISGLAAVATSGDYNDLLNRPILFSGNYNDLTNKPTLFSGSYGDLTDKPTLFSGDYNDLTNKPTIPVVDLTKAQADELYQPKGNYALTEDLFSGSYNDLTDKPSLFSGNYNDLTNKPTLFSGSYNDLTDKPTLFSGSYNDLSDKPTIPTVPTISTNITSDAASDTKTTSPKAVKDFVEGKGYLTQHQDISGKADQTDLEALEDRVEALEQGDSGSTDEDKCVKLVKDPANYLKAGVGDIIKYNGLTTSDFKHGHDYECTKKGNVGYSVSSGDYVLDVAESATNEDFIAAMANEVKPFKYSESVALDDYTEYCAVTNPNVILGCSNKSKANLVVGDVLVSLPYMTPVSVITAVSGSTVTAKFLSGGIDFEIKKSDGDWIGYAYIFTNPEGAKVIITDGDFLTTMTPEPYPPSSTSNYLDKYVAITGKGTYSGTGTNIAITKYYQSTEVAGTPSEWVEAKPCDCSVDNELSSTSEYAVQNKVLYNELRITESDTSSAITINSVTNSDEEVLFTTLDANDFATATVGGRQVSIFPSSQYSPGNSFFIKNCLGKIFVFEGNNYLSNMDFYIAFDRGANTEFLDGSSNVFSYPSIEWFTWFHSDEVQQITGTQYYYFRDIVVMDWDVDATVPSSTVKSLKQKIEELESNISVDSELSSVSEKALQNKVLYNELRITETSSSPVLSIEGDYFPIVELDTNEFEKITSSSVGGDIYIIPLLDTSKAYSIKNSDGRYFDFSQSQVSSPLVFTKFDSNTFYLRVGGNHYWQLHDNFNGVWFTSYTNITYEEEGNHTVSITADHTLQPNATETTDSISTVKSLKQKIAELEARIEQISAQLQS